MVAAKVKGVYEAEAKERQRKAGENYGRGKVPANLPEPKGDARDKAGESLNVGGRTVDACK